MGKPPYPRSIAGLLRYRHQPVAVKLPAPVDVFERAVVVGDALRLLRTRPRARFWARAERIVPRRAYVAARETHR
jgi:hypothetical protein